MTRTFEKRYASRVLFDEALAASREAAAVARASRYLRVPDVLGADPERLVVRFEEMTGWHTLTMLIRSRRFQGLPRERLGDLFRTIGRALAEYHAGTSKIHGDFDSTNILYRADESRVCLIDFSRPDFDDRPDYCRGSIYRDLALFLVHLRVKYPPHQLHLAFRAQNRILSGDFLEGYFEVAPGTYRFNELQAEFRACLGIPYLARTFIRRFLWWTDRFGIEDLR